MLNKTPIDDVYDNTVQEEITEQEIDEWRERRKKAMEFSR
jgi:hypothetical protein